jgi:hypothetical protein
MSIKGNRWQGDSGEGRKGGGEQRMNLSNYIICRYELA